MHEDRRGDSPDGEAPDPDGLVDVRTEGRRRDLESTDRDESSSRRDVASEVRDQVADDHDEEAARLDDRDDVADRHTLRVEEMRGRSRSGRVRAAGDRERARLDRQRAGTDRDDALLDREHAEDDRDEAEADRRSAGIDELTGARRRGVGLQNLANEVGRAHREGHSHLVVAYVDVDGLKSVNDGQGHPAGDKILQAVARTFQRHMRSYDLLVRLGGDEFLGVLPNVGLVSARERFGRVKTELARSGHAISIGYAELREGDSADDLVGRADAELLTVRSRVRE